MARQHSAKRIDHVLFLLGASTCDNGSRQEKNLVGSHEACVARIYGRDASDKFEVGAVVDGSITSVGADEG